MGVGKKLTMEATAFVAGEYGEEINSKLIRIANILIDEDVESELVGEIGGLIGDIAGVNFVAGIEFGEMRPEAAEKLKH